MQIYITPEMLGAAEHVPPNEKPSLLQMDTVSLLEYVSKMAGNSPTSGWTWAKNLLPIVQALEVSRLQQIHEREHDEARQEAKRLRQMAAEARLAQAQAWLLFAQQMPDVLAVAKLILEKDSSPDEDSSDEDRSRADFSLDNNETETPEDLVNPQNFTPTDTPEPIATSTPEINSEALVDA